MNVGKATIVQLCPVPAGFYCDERNVLALALVELEVVEDNGDAFTGREIWPVTCGYAGEADSLHLWTPAEDCDVIYKLSAYGDFATPPVIGYVP